MERNVVCSAVEACNEEMARAARLEFRLPTAEAFYYLCYSSSSSETRASLLPLSPPPPLSLWLFDTKLFERQKYALSLSLSLSLSLWLFDTKLFERQNYALSLSLSDDSLSSLQLVQAVHNMKYDHTILT